MVVIENYDLAYVTIAGKLRSWSEGCTNFGGVYMS